MSFQKAIYRRLDFGINEKNDPVQSTSSGTTLDFDENPPSSGNKRTIEDVSPDSDSTANVDTSVSVQSPVQKAPRRSPQPRRSPRLALKALRGVLVKRQKQAKDRLQEKAIEDLHKSKEVTTLKGLEECISSLNSSLHCDLEAITGHQNSVVLSVYPRKEKSYTEQLGSFQPVRLLFSPTGHYKFQVFIYQTLEEGTIDLRDKAAVKSVIDKLRVDSGFVMCPGLADYDAIMSDIRFQPSNVKVELWPWRRASAVKCKLWHKPRKQQSSEQEEMPDENMCGECRFVRRRMLVLRQNRNSMDENERLQRQQASSKVRLSVLSPESQKARQDNVRRERKNFRRVAERMIKRTSFTVNEQQNNELVKLIECLESSKEGQEGLKKVFEEAENHKPGTGKVLSEMWQMEKEDFFKDQRKNGKLKHFDFHHLTVNRFCKIFVLEMCYLSPSRERSKYMTEIFN